MIKSDSLSFFATTAKGMEPLLQQELQALGATSGQTVRAGVHFKGTMEVAYRALLWSRIANRILLPLKTFNAADEAKLYGGVKSIKWSDHFTNAETFSIDFVSSNSQITHTHFGALKSKDAICDQFRSNTGERPSVDSVNPDIRINIYVSNDEATVSIDLSGQSLHRRGYREEGVEAPLKENLAAAVLMSAGWGEAVKNGRQTGKMPAFMDPMCGSGTLPIEAAMMALDIAPGLKRGRYGFMGWQGHVPALWNRLVTEAKAREITDRKLLPRIVGYDCDPRAVRVAISNLERAGLTGKVHIEKRELSQLEPVQDNGILAINPPYGERLGEEEELKPLYKELGDLFKKRFAGWQGFVLTSNPELAHSIGLKASRRFVLFNGALECRLLKYEMYAGSKTPKAPQGDETKSTELNALNS
jgi:23S rRNA (guanine2445-N2)-methyltransferase / 23S rRNA (guanine2069-N7)-methyltransferase